MTDWFSDPRVAQVRQTCTACPEQYEGTLTNGRDFYFRYRAGVASLAVGNDPRGRVDVSTEHGDGMQGIFASNDDRNHVFTELLDQVSDGVDPAADLDLQDRAGLASVWLRPDTPDQQGSLHVELVGRPKRYLVIWLREPHNRPEWSWVLPDSAVPLWRDPDV